MSVTVSPFGPPRSLRAVSRVHILWLALIAATWGLAQYGADLARSWDMRWIMKYPPGWRIGLKDLISRWMNWLVEDASFGLFTFHDATRALSWLIEQPYNLVLSLLSSGFVTGVGSDAVQWLPPLSWLAVICAVMALGHYAGRWRLAALAGGCFAYLAIFGQWQSAMITLASIAIAVPIGVVCGLLLGITAYRHPRFETAIAPLLDLMQTIPIFAYLVPILFLFGFGPVAALVATLIYAMPPMVRISTLALQQVDAEIKELGLMTGCTSRQMMWKILVPSAMPSLMVGVNQVIMLSLNMVIIASMIGAGGLGYDVLTSLRRLDIGGGLEAGLAIVVLAIALDRLSQALAGRRADIRQDAGVLDIAKDPGPAPLVTQSRWSLAAMKRHPRTVLVTALIAATLAMGYIVPGVQSYPETLELGTGTFWEGVVRWLNVNFFDTLEAIKTAILLGFMLPVKRFLLGIPWPWAMIMIGAIGWQVGRWQLALLCTALAGFIVVNGMWEKAMITLYLCGVSVTIASAIGLPLGILAASNRRAGRIIGIFIDTLQTLPSFVYLIPVVMLFRVGDFTALIAIVLYALAPAVRYTAHGVGGIATQLIEAGYASGCTSGQILRRIRLPLALPQILLGLNQTIMLALSMLVITALVGTRDLGQEVYIALTKADTGRGIVAGLSVAFIAIILDRIISAGARSARRRYGLD